MNAPRRRYLIEKNDAFYGRALILIMLIIYLTNFNQMQSCQQLIQKESAISRPKPCIKLLYILVIRRQHFAVMLKDED